MKRIVSLIFVFLCIGLTSCSEDNDDKVSLTNVTFNFSHNWDEIPITNSDFNTIKFTNAHGNQLSIERLRYLISKITFYKIDGSTTVLDGYNLVDVTNNENLSFTPTTFLTTGSYSDVTFTFGFNNEDNSNNYEDLNSALWSVPAILGSGYHYMQLDGKFLNKTGTEQGFNYHAIRAVDNPGANPTFPQDTFFNVSLGAITISNNATFNIEMNIAKWFKNPKTWDLNILNQTLMPNSAAQIMMFEYGQDVFNLKTVNQ
ncbi:MbnP family protein [uncultured Algibacter sp.]|uniref:MbnP family protein n=1 Tax=uncultured Algibacter sp. TaxID=298659 RepID=UPI002636D630|nr:MbnP family protein [uncultured Algibacter sp.]